MLNYTVNARRVDAHGSVATCKSASLVIDTDLSGRVDAFNPAELFLASLAACMLKGIERVVPMIKFDLRGVEARLTGVRQDAPPKIVSVSYELIVDSGESEQRLELLHTNVRKYGTIFNTVAASTNVAGTLRRKVETDS